MVLKKNKIGIEIEEDSLKELKKVLFQRGLSASQFISYIAELVSMRDSRMEELLDEALINFKDFRSNERESKIKDAEALYKLIELKLQNKQNGT
jgi:hypothetical protein